MPTSIGDKDEELRAEFTKRLAAAIQGLVLAYDCYPHQGGISVRDENGDIWEISILKSDASALVCETRRGAKKYE